MQQSNYYQTISALLQQFQHPQNPPILAPVNPLQQQLLNAVQAVDQNPLRQGGFNALQSLQQQTPQPSNIASNPTQLLSDALKLIAPVGQSPNDEQLLVMALHSGLSQGFDHKKAIETLHGVNNHAANLWKDYYLENKTRIDELVDQRQPAKTTKKPVRFDLEEKVSPPPPEIKNKQPKKERLSHGGPSTSSEPTRTHPIPPGSESPLPPRVRRHHSSSWHSDLPNSPPPEDEPVPPTKVVKGFRGNSYTAEDKKYFVKYVSWALQNDPSLTKGEIVARITERVPHHTYNSWASYWARDSFADRALAAARGKLAEIDDGNVLDDEDSRDSEEKTSSADEEDDNDAAMGGPGSTFGAADIKVMAKYIAKYSPVQWSEMSNKQRWFPFHEEFPQRSDKCYMEKYRNMEPEFLRLAERYRKRTRKQLDMQRGTPSWANAVGRKRRSSAHGSPSKRTREME